MFLLGSGDDNADNIRDFSDERCQHDRVVISVCTGGVRRPIHHCNDQSKLEFVCHIRLRDLEGGRYQFCSVFDLSSFNRNFRIVLGIPNVVETNLSARRAGYGEMQEPVLVPIINVVEEYEGVDWQRMRKDGMVRLYKLNSCPHGLTQTPNVASGVGIRRALPNRKLEMVGSGSHWVIGERFMDDDGPQHVIQSAPEVVNNIGNLERPPYDVRFPMDAGSDCVVGHLCIVRRDTAIRFKVEPSPNFRIEVIQQFFSAS